MKIRKILAAALTAAIMAGYGTVAAFAAAQPDIQVRDNGQQNEYEISLQGMTSQAYGVQFDVTVGSGQEITVEWADQSEAVVQEAVQEIDDGKTTITFYVSKLRPLTNGTAAPIATISTKEEMKDSSFKTSGVMKIVDKKQAAAVYENIRLDARVTDTSTGGNSSGRGDGDSSDKSEKNTAAVTWDSVFGKVKTRDGRKTLKLTMKDGQRLNSEVMRQVLQEKIVLTLDYGEFTWTFDGIKGGEVPAKRQTYDFSIQNMNRKNLSQAAEGSDILQFEIAYSGAMPCAAVLSAPVGSQYAGQTVYLALYNEMEGTLQKQTTAVVSEDGVAAFDMEHASMYIVTTKDLWAAPTGAPQQGSVEGVATVIVPPLENEEEAVQEEASQPEGTEESRPETEETSQTEQEEGKRPQIQPKTMMIVLAAACTLLLIGGVVFAVVKKRRL